MINWKDKEEVKKYHRDIYRKKYLHINGKCITCKKRIYTEKCELCGYKGIQLQYHHWNNLDTTKGIWICVICHSFINRLERGLDKVYFKLKKRINRKPVAL